MLLLAIIGLGGMWGGCGEFKKWKMAIIGTVITAFTIVLILTYSRGGGIAYGVGLMFLIYYAPHLRILCLCCMLGFGMGIILIPKGLDRVGSMADEEDRSITNRLEVWKGALEITADYPFSGIGVDQFGKQFSAWYQPRNMDTSYKTALNNYLTISSERGIFALLIYLMALLTPWLAAFRVAQKDQNLVILGLCASFLAYVISALFTCSLGFWHVTTLGGIIWLILLLYVISHSYWHKQFLNSRILSLSVGVYLLLILLILLIGNRLLLSLPTRVKFLTFNAAQQNQAVAVVYPQHQLSCGVVLYFHGEGQNILDTAKDTLRPLAEEGFTIVSANYRQRGNDGLTDACTLLRWTDIQSEWNGMPLYLCGFDLGGRISILAACKESQSRLKAVTAISANTDWPFPNLSPFNQINHLNVPVLLLYGRYDRGVSLDEYQRFIEQAQKNRKEVKLTAFDTDHQLDDQWLNGLHQASEFFKLYP